MPLRRHKTKNLILKLEFYFTSRNSKELRNYNCGIHLFNN